ncbi:aldo/keto reductase [Synechococcus sp. CBW1002]|nr:aldo/keto reductase [Synechococcus sp. CBW1002]
MGSGSRAYRQRLLSQALELGVTHFDVARYYGLGEAESELGRFLKANPGKATVATKFGINPLPFATAGFSRLFSRLGAQSFGKQIERTAGERTHRFKLAEARAALETSLRKLKVDTIDVYLLHDCRSKDVRNPDLLNFLMKSKADGKIRSFGVASEIESILEIDQTIPAYTNVIQLENSLLRPNLKRIPSLPNRAVITHRALSHNLVKLLELITQHSKQAEAWSDELGVDLKDPLVLANAMLAYAAAENPNGITLFSTTKIRRIKSNVCAIQHPILPPQKLQRLMELLVAFK